MLLSWIGVLISLIVICKCDQCIRYEFHETAINQEGNAELLINDCRSKNSKVTDYNVHLLQIYGPPMINITFNCCSSLPCRNDLQCPFNFNCNRGKCLVADCNLRDEIEIVEVENEECIIDEDCYFKIPLDKKHCNCLSETSECIHKENCAKKCKRCAFVGDHWSDYVNNNSIDAGLYNSNESPGASLINDLLPIRHNNTSTPSSLVEFNLNSLINSEPESDSNELRSGDFSRLLNPNRIVNNSSTSTTTIAPFTNRTSNRPILSNGGGTNRNSLISSNVNTTNSRSNSVRSSTTTTTTSTTTIRPSTSSRKPDEDLSSSFGFTRNDLPRNILNELTRSSSFEPSSIISSTTTSRTTTTSRSTTSTTTTTTTSSPVASSSEETSSSNEANSNEFIRLNNNSTIDEFLFTRTDNSNNNNEENSSNATNLTNESLENNSLVNIFSSLISGNSSFITTNASSSFSSPVVNSISIPLINSSNTRTNNPFNSPFNNLFNSSPIITTTRTPTTTIASTTISTTTQPTVTSTAISNNSSTVLTSAAVLSAASILNRSRSAARNNDNRFANRRTSSRSTNPAGRSLLNNHRLIHIPNNRLNNRVNRRSSATTMTTTTTTIKPPINPYYHLSSVLGNHNAFSEMIPEVLYDIDIPRLNSTSVH